MVGMQQALATAIALIERFEGVESEAYLDSIGVPTICAGLTRYPNGVPVRLGDECDLRVCRGYLRQMLEQEYVPALLRIPGFSRLGPERQAVLLSFAWNLGSGFYGAEGFETITRVLEEGSKNPDKYSAMPQALALYDKAGGQALPGLTNRRREEGRLWNIEDDGIMIFTANQDTYLKIYPLEAAYLSDLGKEFFKKGDKVQVSRVDEIPGDGHAWFNTLEPPGRRAAFLPHWTAGTAAPAPVVPKAVDWKDFSCPIGKFITVGEVLQYDSRRRPAAGSAEERSILAICREFDAIREAWGGALGVTSGYRPEPINSQVGGVRNSYHTRGQALDIYPIGESLDKFYQWIRRRWSGGLGDGRNRGFVHIDTRDGGKFVRSADAAPAAVWLY
jgi:GH24 family phage-related lysozyme (muramidase)